MNINIEFTYEPQFTYEPLIHKEIAESYAKGTYIEEI